MAFGSIFLKTYRLHSIFNNKTMVVQPISDTKLLYRLSALIFFDATLFLIWGLITPIHILASGQRECVSDGDTAFISILIVVKGILLAFGCYVTFQVRQIPSNWNESRYIAVSIYNVVVLSFVYVIINYAISIPISSFTIAQAVFILVGTTITLCSMFIPKFILIYHNDFAYRLPALKHLKSQSKEYSLDVPASAKTNSELPEIDSKNGDSRENTANSKESNRQRALKLQEMYKKLTTELLSASERVRHKNQRIEELRTEVARMSLALQDLVNEISYHFYRTGEGYLPDVDDIKRKMVAIGPAIKIAPFKSRGGEAPFSRGVAGDPETFPDYVPAPSSPVNLANLELTTTNDNNGTSNNGIPNLSTNDSNSTNINSLNPPNHDTNLSINITNPNITDSDTTK